LAPEGQAATRKTAKGLKNQCSGSGSNGMTPSVEHHVCMFVVGAKTPIATSQLRPDAMQK
jgi:hypothetical protein